MTDGIAKLHKLLDWELLEGSHEFPGEDGGTCINEAAVVAAGLPYRSISSTDDFPPCFSIPMGKLLLVLNDGLDDEDRQKLKPFVIRLAGSKSPRDVERKRLQFILDGVAEALMSEWRAGFASVLNEIPTIQSPDDIDDIIGKLEDAKNDEVRSFMERIENISLPRFFDRDLEGPAVRIAEAIADIGTYEGYESLMDKVLAVVDQAFDIGNKASEMDLQLIKKRMEKAKKLGEDIPTLESADA